MDLFTTAPTPPLAERLRPTRLTEVSGQRHLLGPGKPLRLAFEAKRLHSLILWGPPGVGKTTLGRLAAKEAGAEFMTLSAVTAGVKEIRAAVDAAQHILDQSGRSTVLFVDEIHAFNKTQQDALLPHVEAGLFTLIGGTTENPGFHLNNALLSRAQVYVLEPLGTTDFLELYQRAMPHLEGVTVEPEALDLLMGFCDGDGRRFLNLLEQVANAARGAKRTAVDPSFAQSALSPALKRFDKGGDAFYDQISAFHKSVRGSNPDGALYWMARMLDAGADPRYLARRMLAIASEDVGNADPRGMQVALTAVEAYERLGPAEGERALAQAAVYLALAPKSNAVYNAWNEVKAFVRQRGSDPVPLHLRNAPTELQKQLGHKEGYRYAHHEPNAYAAGQTYLPEGMPAQQWYRPVERGLEIKLGEKLRQLHDWDAQAGSSSAGENPSAG